jgi:hypothetical protein
MSIWLLWTWFFIMPTRLHECPPCPIIMVVTKFGGELFLNKKNSLKWKWWQCEWSKPHPLPSKTIDTIELFLTLKSSITFAINFHLEFKVTNPNNKTMALHPPRTFHKANKTWTHYEHNNNDLLNINPSSP